MRKLVRQFLQKRGYDIVKTGLPVHIYKDTSAFPQYSYHPTPTGKYYLPKGLENDVIAAHMQRGKFFEPEVITLAERFIKPGTTVLDVGANFGQMSIEFARLAGDGGKVYSFEAQQSVFEVLKKNAETNYPGRITPVYATVYNKADEVMFFPEPDFTKFSCYGSFGLGNKTDKGVEVKSMLIDSLEFSQPVSFMKVDVQGSDLFAMQGAVETIRKHRMPILFEFEQQFQETFNTNFQQYVDFVSSIGYRFSETVLDINFLILPNN